LNSITSLHGSATLLERRWRELSDEMRDELLATVVRHTSALSSVLGAIVPNLSPALRAELLALVTEHRGIIMLGADGADVPSPLD
jgi:hypothetical protein